MLPAFVKTNADLSRLNTLAVPSRCQYFAQVHTLDALREAVAWAQSRDLPVHVLGGGSNLVLGEQIEGLVLQPNVLGREFEPLDHHHLIATVGAGENWHSVVQWSLAQGFYGLENLALIPGSVGAAPVQNIGAYGVELEQLAVRVDAFDMVTAQMVSFDRAACEFAYRDSVFKKPASSRYIITSVCLRLSRQAQVNLTYPALKDALPSDSDLTPEQVFASVCALRLQKLPVPSQLPNCGSFFKNPIVSATAYQQLQQRFAQVVGFTLPDTNLKKIAAAWLIDQAGWKGVSEYGVGVHSQQALVLVNPNRLPAQNVLRLARAIQQSVLEKFGIALEMEPRCIGIAPSVVSP